MYSSSGEKMYPRIHLDKCLYELVSILEHDRIDISERIDIKKTNPPKKCKICHYWYFIGIDFKYEPYFFNGCHGLMQKAVSFNDVAIFYAKGSAYRIYFWYMSKDNPMNIMKNYNLIDKIGVLYIFLSTYKNELLNLISKKRDTK